MSLTYPYPRSSRGRPHTFPPISLSKKNVSRFNRYYYLDIVLSLFIMRYKQSCRDLIIWLRKKITQRNCEFNNYLMFWMVVSFSINPFNATRINISPLPSSQRITLNQTKCTGLMIAPLTWHVLIWPVPQCAMSSGTKDHNITRTTTLHPIQTLPHRDKLSVQQSNQHQGCVQQ